MGIICYPGRDVLDTDLGIGADRIGGFVTVLLQDIIEPLHVRGKEGCWIEASPILGSIPANCSARDQRLCPCQSR